MLNKILISVFVLIVLSLPIYSTTVTYDERCSYFIEESNLLISKGKLEEAEEILRTALKSCKDNPDININLGTIYIMQENLPKAREYLFKALESKVNISGKEYVLFYNLGLYYYKTSNLNEAINFYKKSIEANPNFGNSYFNLALIYFKTGDNQKAYSNFKTAEEIFTKQQNYPYLQKTQELLNKISIYLDTPAAKVQRTAKELPSQYTLLLENASKDFKQGKVKEAVDTMIYLIQENPDYPDAYYRLGVVYVALEEYPKAFELFEKTVEKDPSFYKAYINLGIICGKQNLDDKALYYLNKALEYDPKNPKAYYNIGIIYQKQGDYLKTQEFFEKALNCAYDAKDTDFASVITKSIASLYSTRQERLAGQ